jgi:hypothetical protein
VFYARDFPRGVKDWCAALFLTPSVWDFFVRQWVLRFARCLWPPFPGRWPRLAPASRPFHLVVSLQQAHSQSPVLALCLFDF